VTKVLVLTQRSVREALRTPEALLPTLFIPLFFLVVNVGQAARIFPSGSTPFLAGQNYDAFQLDKTAVAAGEYWLDYSERTIRREVGKAPDGVHRAPTQWLDDDGENIGQPLRVVGVARRAPFLRHVRDGQGCRVSRRRP